MNQRRRDFGDILGDASYGVAQAGGSHGASLSTELLVSPGQMLYMQIPHKELRDFAEGVFPAFKTNQFADVLSGWQHRYKAGHDLLLDVPSTFTTHGPMEGLKHAGHILLTDFPTKAGIPIPGLSHSGLGHMLEHWGIPKAWMSLNISDAGFGFLAIADSHSTLMAALQGHLSMDFGTAVQTFGAGALELKLAMIATANPVLITAAGIQNILAGLVATWKTFSVYVDPLDFFGATGMSALLGFGFAHGLAGERLTDASRDAIRSGTIGALYSVSTAFGYGALAGFVVCRLASALAKHHNAQVGDRLTVDPHTYRLLVETLCSGNTGIEELLAAAAPRWLPANGQPLSDKPCSLLSEAKPLSAAARKLEDRAVTLSTGTRAISDQTITLPDDPNGLSDIYRSALSSMKSQRKR